MSKKLFVLITTLLLILAACGNKDDDSSKSNTHKYKTDEGKTVEIPDKPKRVVVLTTDQGSFQKLGVDPVGTDADFPKSKYVDDKDAKRVGSEDIEAVTKLKPDLIITYNANPQIKKFEKIAPTVPFDHSKRTFKEVHVEIGKLLGKEDKAKEQVKELEDLMSKEGKTVKEEIGKDSTVSIMEVGPKELTLIGKNFGRGSEVIYQGFGFKHPAAAEKDIPKEGWLTTSFENFSKYTGDYLLIPTEDGKKPTSSLIDGSIWKNTKAVKEDHVYYYPKNEFMYSDPISIEKQTEYLKNMLTK
ncbi:MULTISPECIES: ABC transporter substrate-binding protein [Mammaliicoccus]|uniref:ABC transporter substrate-binding protein n=1 Tax=Mammaliicoccus fleurettii TaxID=150056 RepID=A0ABS5MMH0_9STAP|nr:MULTISPECIES: ABC transporter substrate-binding protein [Mammaliicoccus]HCN60820.1 iron-siderophore ABC transporter substrate-binding protein [Staphylococcus sp.]MBL0847359.1 ABC transporter substrate-binding protein [Mammaliicoccus fleurettii]MBO3063387.1 ABC transporter substrate-binding protein [Mammaliicoccus fleurettii]MBS3672222.1 ABC transporter substrate-binding protein [Mammaliicoccus fleurettii]MBS3697109.1 ABC transporter substrate-binding protein [Mammaliicoccus fleurettii]